MNNNLGWTVYDDDLVTEQSGVGWHHSGFVPVSIKRSFCAESLLFS